MDFQTFKGAVKELADMTKKRGCFNCEHLKGHYSRNPMECSEECEIAGSPFWDDETGKFYPDYQDCPHWKLRIDDGFYDKYCDQNENETV